VTEERSEALAMEQLARLAYDATESRKFPTS